MVLSEGADISVFMVEDGIQELDQIGLILGLLTDIAKADLDSATAFLETVAEDGNL